VPSVCWPGRTALDSPAVCVVQTRERGHYCQGMLSGVFSTKDEQEPPALDADVIVLPQFPCCVIHFFPEIFASFELADRKTGQPCPRVRRDFERAMEVPLSRERARPRERRTGGYPVSECLVPEADLQGQPQTWPGLPFSAKVEEAQNTRSLDGAKNSTTQHRQQTPNCCSLG
jgi:hypothetical protein